MKIRTKILLISFLAAAIYAASSGAADIDFCFTDAEDPYPFRFEVTYDTDNRLLKGLAIYEDPVGGDIVAGTLAGYIDGGLIFLADGVYDTDLSFYVINRRNFKGKCWGIWRGAVGEIYDSPRDVSFVPCLLSQARDKPSPPHPSRKQTREESFSCFRDAMFSTSPFYIRYPMSLLGAPLISGYMDMSTMTYENGLVTGVRLGGKVYLAVSYDTGGVRFWVINASGGSAGCKSFLVEEDGTNPHLVNYSNMIPCN